MILISPYIEKLFTCRDIEFKNSLSKGEYKRQIEAQIFLELTNQKGGDCWILKTREELQNRPLEEHLFWFVNSVSFIRFNSSLFELRSNTQRWDHVLIA
jgi:hypothetical protein